MADVKSRALEFTTRSALAPTTDQDTALTARLIGDEYEVGCLFAHGVVQVIAVLQRAATVKLIEMVFSEADRQINEVKDMARQGEIPLDVTTFSELHDLCDANMIGCGGDEECFSEHALVGVGTIDLSEAWCGVINCGHNAVGAMLAAGGLLSLTPPRSR